MKTIIDFWRTVRSTGWLLPLIMLAFIMATFLMTGCSQEKVTFSEREIKWLMAHNLYESSRNLPDESKRKIKEIVSTEIQLIDELDSLVIEMNDLFADTSGVRFEFDHPLK